MADRKARSFQFKVPPGTRLRDIKDAIELQIEDNYITVFQQINAYEYLVELARGTHVDELIQHGFDVEESHYSCHPPHGYYLNVSVMGLKVFISDDEVFSKLSTYGEIKGEVIRLKYKQGHDLAGLENGNRLVRMVLTAQSIPYSLQIGGEWCRIIHNNQQRICSNCNETGHSRKDCPTIECRKCHQLGHLSFHCQANNTTTTVEDEDITENTEHPNEPENSLEDEEITSEDDAEVFNKEITAMNPHLERPDAIIQENQTPTLKRQHQTDSDSDGTPLSQRHRKKHEPNLKAARRFTKHDDIQPSKSGHSLC